MGHKGEECPLHYPSRRWRDASALPCLEERGASTLGPWHQPHSCPRMPLGVTKGTLRAASPSEELITFKLCCLRGCRARSAVALPFTPSGHPCPGLTAQLQPPGLQTPTGCLSVYQLLQSQSLNLQTSYSQPLCLLAVLHVFSWCL